MISAPALAMRQLLRQKLRLGVAISGVSFAVVLMLTQLGFWDVALMASVKLHAALRADAIVLDAESYAMQFARPFPRQHAYRALAHPQVDSVDLLYLKLGRWKNPVDRSSRMIYVIGADPDRDLLDLKLTPENLRALKMPETVLFDTRSRPEFGPIGELLAAGEPILTEIEAQRVEVVGSFASGATFAADGTVLTSAQTFLSIFPRDPAQIDLGMLHLSPGADAAVVCNELESIFPETVRVMPLEAFTAMELEFWKKSTAIGFVFGFGAIMGFIVGAVIVYQILYADVSDHLAEYATLKAMGYTNTYLSGIVLSEALILSLVGFLPGVFLASIIFDLCRQATMLPMTLTPELAIQVLSLTILMCCLSGSIAVRKVQSADPADVF